MQIRCGGVISKKVNSSVSIIEIVVNSRRRMHLCMQDDQNGQKMMVLTSAEETRLTCFILLQNIFFWSNQPSLTADANTIINFPWYPRKIVHFSLVLSPSRVYYDFYGKYMQNRSLVVNFGFEWNKMKLQDIQIEIDTTIKN
jgi:hypothetical protein